VALAKIDSKADISNMSVTGFTRCSVCTAQIPIHFLPSLYRAFHALTFSPNPSSYDQQNFCLIHQEEADVITQALDANWPLHQNFQNLFERVMKQRCRLYMLAMNPQQSQYYDLSVRCAMESPVKGLPPKLRVSAYGTG